MAWNLRQRLSCLALIGLVFLTLYGFARHYSPPLVAYVVEQTLIQKSPPGMSVEVVRDRFETVMNSTKPADKMYRLLSLSNYLEKVQKLAPEEFDELLGWTNSAGK